MNDSTQNEVTSEIRPSWARETRVNEIDVEHRRVFPATVDGEHRSAVLLYQFESHDGTVIEAGAELLAFGETLDVEDLHALGEALYTAAEVMRAMGLTVVRPDRR